MSDSMQFNVQCLEHRRMLAGNVSVSALGGDLRIDGDDAANELVITGTAIPGEYRIVGGNGTTINGLNEVTISGVNDDFRIKLKGGNDEIGFFLGSVPDDLQIRTGKGDDIVFLLAFDVGDDADIRTGSGDDAAGIDECTVGDRIKIRTESGHDQVLLKTVDGQTASIHTGGHDDQALILFNSFQEELSLKMGTGDDAIYEKSNSGDVRLNGGSGYDSRYAGGYIGHSFEANDVVSYSYSIQCSPVSGEVDLLVNLIVI